MTAEVGDIILSNAATTTAFDTAYLRAAVRSSDDTLALYMHEARFGGPPVMNRFAFAGVPQLAIR